MTDLDISNLEETLGRGLQGGYISQDTSELILRHRKLSRENITSYRETYEALCNHHREVEGNYNSLINGDSK